MSDEENGSEDGLSQEDMQREMAKMRSGNWPRRTAMV